MADFLAVDLLRAKRDGAEWTDAHIQWFIRGIASREIPDYQAAAFLANVFHRGLSPRELATLTAAIAGSGRMFDLSALGVPTADKHSTGGVGDKISLPLAPLVASNGVTVPMCSGRGLGHTGGTLDKLEAIRGYRTRLTYDEFVDILRRVGCSIAGQSADLAPADSVLYELRDVTGFVESLPLIVSSIASKKLAAGPRALVYDVKCGRGAFLKTRAEAEALAERLVATTVAAGRRAVAILTDMNAPLGAAIGNANEAAESVAVLRGDGPADVVEETVVLGAAMLMLAGAQPGFEEAAAAMHARIADGSGLAKFRAMVDAHGGDLGVVDDPAWLRMSAHQATVRASRDGVVRDIDSLRLGLAGVAMGAGRARREDVIDPGAGFDLRMRVGDAVREGDVLAHVFANSAERQMIGEEAVSAAVDLAPVGTAVTPLASRILAVVATGGMAAWGSAEADALLCRAATE